MSPCRTQHPQRAARWLIGGVATLLFSLEPSLSLVLLSIGLAALAVTWIVMLASLLLRDCLERVVDHFRDARN